MRGQILLIDDNLVDIKVLSSVLERSGFACAGFTDFAKAFEWLQSNSPQLIFLDLQMPNITGYDIIPQLRDFKKTAKTPIIIVSGKNQTEDVMKAIQLGANDYVVKPIDPLVLQEKAEKFGSTKESDFHSVDIGGADGIAAYIAKSIHIKAASEFGLKLHSDHPLQNGDVIEIAGLNIDFFGADKVIVRCLSCEKHKNQNSYFIQTTYTGMTESQRQVIRKSCRQVWIQSKQGAA